MMVQIPVYLCIQKCLVLPGGLLLDLPSNAQFAAVKQLKQCALCNGLIIYDGHKQYYSKKKPRGGKWIYQSSLH